MARVTAWMPISLLAAAMLACVGCAPVTAPGPGGTLPSVGESVTVGPLEYHLDATLTPEPGSGSSKRLDFSIRAANPTEETATLYPETPDVSVHGEVGEIPIVGGEGESEGWSMVPGTYSSETTAALAPGGYFLMRRTLLVDDTDDGLTVTVDAQDNGGVTWGLR